MEARVDAHELRVILDGMEARGRAIGHVLPAIAEELVAAVHDVYQAEGPGWAPLAASTLRRRRGTGGVKILQDTGVMAGSTAPGVGADYAEAIAGVDYAKYHSPDRQGRDPFDLGPFEPGVLEEVASMVAEEGARL